MCNAPRRAALFATRFCGVGFVDICVRSSSKFTVLCKLKSEMCSASCALQRRSARVQPVLHCVVHAGRHCARGVMWLYVCCGVARNASLRFSLLSAPLAAPLFRPHSLPQSTVQILCTCGAQYVFLVVVGAAVLVYLVYIVYLLARVFRNMCLKRALLPRLAAQRRRLYLVRLRARERSLPRLTFAHKSALSCIVSQPIAISPEISIRTDTYLAARIVLRRSRFLFLL